MYQLVYVRQAKIACSSFESSRDVVGQFVPETK